MVSYRVIGQPTPQTTVQGKVTGGAEYVADVSLPGMLGSAILRSTRSHARIIRIDTAAAELLPGVHVVMTGADVYGILVGRRFRDVPILANDKVRFIGERVAAVAADTREIAQQAVELIEVEYEELPAVFDPVEALKDDAPLIHPDVNRYEGLPEKLDKPSNSYINDLSEKGDVDAGFAASDVIVENEFTVARVHQAYMEPHCCIAWLDEAGTMQVWAPSKAPHVLKQTLAAALRMPADQVRVNPISVGGDFGGKGAAMDEPLACYLAQRARRPVKVAMDYTAELTAGAPRHAGVMRLKTGVMRDGTLVAHQLEAVFDGGAYGSVRPGPSLASAGNGAGCYRIPNARLEVKRVYTNNLPGGQMRAPAAPQGFFAAESHIDGVARAIGMDPYDFRMKNLIVNGEETVSGHRYDSIRAKETLQAAVDSAGYGAPKADGVGRGIAMAYRSPGSGESAVTVSLNTNGSVVVTTPVYDQGTGTYTTLRQVVAEELGLPLEHVQVSVVSTDDAPFDSGIGGSRGTRITTGSAYQAVTKARGMLQQTVADANGWPVDQLTVDGTDVVRRDTEERTAWAHVLAKKGQPTKAEAVNIDNDQASVTAFTAQVAEVLVDRETGEVKLLRFTTAHDVGTVINPIGHQGQINGGVVQGIGYGLIEELAVENGLVLTTNLGEFKIPTMQDIPELRTVLLDPEAGVGPYNIKGIGENVNPPAAAAIANAVEDAIGVRVRDLPVTAERVYAELGRASNG